MLQSPPLASMLPFHHAMQVAAAQVRNKFKQVWSSLNKFEQVWTSFNKFEQALISLFF